MSQNEYFMELAFKEAEKAFRKNEIPVGAIVVKENIIIGKGFNQVESLKDPTAHAEILAITAAANYLNSKWLEKCTLYVTLEPCPMCAGAIVLARIPTIVFGAFDPKAGACSTLYNIVEDKRLNHQVHVISGVLDTKCRGILKEFFEKKRKLDVGNLKFGNN
jgi:tRNA(adenine34) deaminase